MIELAAQIVCTVLSVIVLAATGFVAWAVSTEERNLRVLRWIWRYHDWRKGR